MEKDFDELTIADDIAKKCTSCTFLSYKFSYRKLATAWFPLPSMADLKVVVAKA